ncbi:MAG: MFS transporter [Bdellovibrionales bacterium]|nr:MFS transporter [Oligoflexia bacterium]
MTPAWKRFLTLYLVQFLQLLDFISIAPTGALFVSSHKIESSSISYALGAYSAAAIAGSFLMAKFRGPNPRLTLLVLLGLFTLSQLLLMLVVGDASFIFARVLGGLTGGLMGSIAYSQLSAIDDNNHGLWNGRIQTAQSMVTLVGLPACLTVISSLGSNIYFGIIVVLAAVLGIILYQSRFLKPYGILNHSHITMKAMKAHSDIIVTGFSVYFASFLFISQMPNYLINARGVGAGHLSLAYSVSGVLTIILSGTIGKFGDTKNSKLLLAIFCVLILATQMLFFGFIGLNVCLFLGLPFYLLLSTGRAIHQRGIILQKKAEDSISMHLINNVAIRCGILASGLALGLISARFENIADVFKFANVASMLCGLLLACALFVKYYSNSKKALG